MPYILKCVKVFFETREQRSADLVITRDGARFWAFRDIGIRNFEAGWYVLAPSGEESICLSLVRLDDWRRIELVGQANKKTLCRLEAGAYKMSVQGLEEDIISLKPMKLLDLGRELVIRGLSALSHGLPLKKVFEKVKNILFERQTMGVGQTAKNANLEEVTHKAGPLNTRAICTYSLDAPAHHSSFPVVKLQAGQWESLSLEALRSRLKTPYRAHSHLIVTDQNDILLPQAQKLFADALTNTPEALVILGDKISPDGTPLAVFQGCGGDDLLYPTLPPTPFLLNLTPNTSQRRVCLDVPVAIGAINWPPLNAERPLDDLLRLSVIIPTRDRLTTLRPCLMSLKSQCAPYWQDRLEIILIDNGSREPQTLAFFDEMSKENIKIIRHDAEFNFAHLCNLGAQQATGNVLVFLNNDVVFDDGDPLKALAAFALDPKIGMVGAKLVYHDQSLQHGGVFLGLTQICGHLGRTMDFQNQSRHVWLSRPSRRSAVTAAFCAVEARKFHEAGGFDAEHFPVTLNDVDLCLRLTRLGYGSVFVPQAKAVHLESQSRGLDDTEEKKKRRIQEIKAFIDTYGEEILNDPYLSPCLQKAMEQIGVK